jgi:alpha-L-fucosidase 2
MIHGGVEEEHLSFNVSSLWTGNEIEMGSYQPFGDLYFRQAKTTATDYRRELSLDDSLHSVTYRFGSTTQQRSAFASHPDRVIVVQFRNSGPALIQGQLRLTDAHQAQITTSGATIAATGTLSNGLLYHAQVRVELDRGTCRVDQQQQWLRICV